MDLTNLKINNQLIPPNNTNLEAEKKYAVDSCFNIPIKRLTGNNDNKIIDNLLPSYWNYEDENDCENSELYTFEEFIQNNSSPRSLPQSTDNIKQFTSQNSIQSVDQISNEQLTKFSSSLTNDFLCTDGETVTARIDEYNPAIQYFSKNEMINKNIETKKDVFDDKFYSIALEDQNDKKKKQSDLKISGNTSSILRKTFCPTVSSRNNSSTSSLKSAYCYNNEININEIVQDSTNCFEEINQTSTSYNNNNNNNESISNCKLKGELKHNINKYNTPIKTENTIDSQPNWYINKNNLTNNLNFNAQNILNLNSNENDENRENNENEEHKRNIASKLLCCFCATTNFPTPLRRQNQYSVKNEEIINANNFFNKDLIKTTKKCVLANNNNQAEPTKYSWDIEREKNVQNSYKYLNEIDKILIKNPGEINGEQFSIDNCKNCIIILLDYNAGVTIDDCKNCLIVVGPCKSSLFLRDCNNCVIYAICQQFRARDSKKIFLRLFCATAPTIEDSEIEFGELTLCYNKIQEHLNASNLSPLTNNWWRVHNFTPESTKFSIIDLNIKEPKNEFSDNNLVDFSLNELLCNEFLFTPKNVCNLTFSIHESYFFHVKQNRSLQPNESHVLILMKSFEKRVTLHTANELSEKARKFLKLFKNVFIIEHLNEQVKTSDNSVSNEIHLIGLYDLNCRAGEFETIMQTKSKNKSVGGKIIAIELCSNSKNLKKICMETLLSINGLSNVEFIDESRVNYYSKQLARLCKIQNNV